MDKKREIELKPCPYCGGREIRVFDKYYSGAIARAYYVICFDCLTKGPELSGSEAAAEAWNNLPRKVEALPAPKHRPADVLTGKDCRDLGDVLFQNDIYIEHVLPLHAAPAVTHLEESWDALGDSLKGMDEEELGKIFGPDIGDFIADSLDEYDDEALLMAFRRIGGWAIMGTYPTVDNIKLDESGRFSSCSVIGCIQRMFLVWARTYKQAVAKAVREQRRYFRAEVEKARECREPQEPKR